MARAVKQTDDYMSRVLKHIPSEIIMAYISINGVLHTSYNPGNRAERETLLNLLWITLGVLTVLTPLWLWRVVRVRRMSQILISTISVPVWLFALGGPFELLDWYEPAFGAVILPLYTLMVPIMSGSPP